ncbi:MAG: response regulator transcription factor [Flavobacteriales bacterium]|jgi:two-component system LytT family response regulator|nr:response regulator transcription factor [Flavobacteriales bacterium]MBL7957360.1 response regulator transcription factor [Flavobacteriales bacterium]
MIRALIIDDEKPARDKLLMLVQQHFADRITVLAQCEDGEDAVKAIAAHRPDLLFLDVEMPKLSGFDVLRKSDLEGIDVIFTTAYDHYAIKAIKFAAVDYLLKPIDIDQLREALDRVQAKHGLSGGAERMQRMLEDVKSGITPDRLSVPTLHGFELVKVAEIVWCEAVNYYTVLHMTGGQQIAITRSLKEVEETLEGPDFIRIHRSHTINLKHLTKYIKGSGGQVVMSDGKTLDVARLRKDDLLARIGNR